MKCSICFDDIETTSWGWDQGHNAEPVNEGRCCSECNLKVVLPARVNRLRLQSPAMSTPKEN